MKKKNARAWFTCINEACGRRYELDEIVYKCHTCGGLLEVTHDMARLKKERSASEWRALFQKRWKTTNYPYGSGIWGKKEWVLPDIDNNHIISLYEGDTNLCFTRRYGEALGVPDLYIKMCGNSHTGSFKDLGMTVLVSQVNHMIQHGAKIRAVACASTGDTSAALSAYCAFAGIPSIVLLPKGKISTAQLVQPISNNSIVLSLETDFDGCMKVVQEISKRPEFYLANSMNSLRVEGQKSISIEMVQQLEWEVPDFIIIPGGNLGNVSALGKGFQMMLDLGLIRKKPRIVLAQAQKANPLYQSYRNGFKTFEPVKAGKTLASAIQIGNPVSVNKAIKMLKAFDGIVEQASEAELADACAEADKFGYFTCPHTGVALAALKKVIRRGIITRKHRVIVISTAHGLKFSDFKVKYHEEKLSGIRCRFANKPIVLEPKVDKILAVLDKKIR
ncbi:MAG: threonine synthase [Candidatus Raymondbacteria bacterium RifOxyA12_full_50_37]|uniref:Threonine synthase n=1 Tax=Candidatus Raymondbacteria bacterium RIFOXYD12_FULL_49_13 TaxID=1817890 RepID=A0A1F7FK84_UNCRA|nr:MAG: threonine synthase [Candidatus Raymondbacteria bacterium RifOxyA12_full_50_37]OGJ90179.1 MAG: threonine synthase [Candidatus Raymondbacteria bacterium RIFOXYA2_FULL_49_16]OGJ97251.1 MAG: threonine synthase [Candidatus Raymondbacteria bacterium RIFOXYC2_FULL_50_21]OGJ98832.1 MAG: threonine synthase [Candidatus Raymondbacteria bacterium RifOxyB12_full_50_8]OGK07119.1 MAG: threonine synthase [Candidatus Raymondbacteria bacterium RIFOXYD12_FULL_49_13]OGP43081.1 MAG: threonine synthase [Can